MKERKAKAKLHLEEDLLVRRQKVATQGRGGIAAVQGAGCSGAEELSQRAGSLTSPPTLSEARGGSSSVICPSQSVKARQDLSQRRSSESHWEL